jgi:hypothetical protein
VVLVGISRAKEAVHGIAESGKRREFGKIPDIDRILLLLGQAFNRRKPEGKQGEKGESLYMEAATLQAAVLSYGRSAR